MLSAREGGHLGDRALALRVHELLGGGAPWGPGGLGLLAVLGIGQDFLRA